jgi:hypothetical protein
MSDPSNGDLAALIEVVRPASPGLAAALQGPASGIAVSALGRSLLQDAQASLSAVLAATKTNDAATRAAVVAAEQACQLRLRQSGSGLADLAPEVAKELIAAQVQTAQIAATDTQNARSRQLASHDRANEVLAYGVSVGFLLILIVLLFFGDRVSTEFKDLLFTLLGVVGTGWANIISFYFGSSAGSQQKTQAMTDALTARSQGNST